MEVRYRGKGVARCGCGWEIVCGVRSNGFSLPVCGVLKCADPGQSIRPIRTQLQHKVSTNHIVGKIVG